MGKMKWGVEIDVTNLVLTPHRHPALGSDGTGRIGAAIGKDEKKRQQDIYRSFKYQRKGCIKVMKIHFSVSSLISRNERSEGFSINYHFAHWLLMRSDASNDEVSCRRHQILSRDNIFQEIKSFSLQIPHFAPYHHVTAKGVFRSRHLNHLDFNTLLFHFHKQSSAQID